jgi:hypothetical protein
MLKEDYVSFEVAKLLKEKGFDEPLKRFYNSEGQRGISSYYNWNQTDSDYSCPTLQMAMKWLREKYYIYADPIKQGNYNDCSEYYTWIVARMGIIHRNSSVADKLSYEEAVEAALKYSLEKLI